MNNQKGVIHLLLPLILLLAVVGFVVLIYFGVIKNPLKNFNLPFFNNSTKVSVKEEYKNPFKKETQYVNPFQPYKNPFIVAK